MKIHRHLLTSLLLFVVGFGAFNPTAYSQENDTILAQGNPPLTKSMAGKTIILLEWALDIRLSREQQTKILQTLIGYWKTKNQAEINNTVEVANLIDGLMKASEENQLKAKETLRPDLLQGLRQDTDDEISQMVLQVYESTHSPNSKNTSPAYTSSVPKTNKLRVGADGFTGIYRMLRPRALNINNTGSEPGYWIEYITFLPNGYVYWTLPPEGLLYFDPVIAQKAYPDDWGTYEIKNREIHILRGPERTKYIITRDGERLNNPPSLGKGSFRPVPPADGLKLEGNYRRDETEPTITFTTDGKFREGGIFRYFGTRARPDGTTYEDDGKGGSGTYLIEQNTLELRYTDGRVKRIPFIAFPENLAKTPALDSFILLQEETLKRF